MRAAVGEMGDEVLLASERDGHARDRVHGRLPHAVDVLLDGLRPGPWQLECDNGVSFQLDSSYDGAWKSCGVSWRDDVRADLSSTCALKR